MTLTRLAFFKLLGAVGIGQATNRTITMQTPGDPRQCLKEVPGVSKGSIAFEWTRCNAECGPDEERCPLGHCQKPGVVFVEVWPMSGQSPYKLEEHVCSVCGIVYVPPLTKGKG